ncbi:MAG TPA: hypothetical protein VLE48_05865 [Terriglobales bacterium]|nr:hypothetical protein [Terriglobales bacterium]
MSLRCRRILLEAAVGLVLWTAAGTPALAQSRNDSIAAATPLTNGTFNASISPFGDPITVTDPDEDFYAVTVAASATLTVDVVGPGLNPPSPMDPVIEIVNNAGTRLTTCKDPGDDSPPGGSGITPDPTPNVFDDSCVNDDISLGVNRNSHLDFRNTSGGTVTVFIRVLDWSGNARPDFRYQITISGAQ